MKQIFRITMVTAVLSLTAASQASSNSAGENKAFSCMNKQTFEINSECVSQNIESNLVFQKAENAVLVNADNASDRALASMTFDQRSMTISIVAHKDAVIASNEASKIISQK